MPESPIKTTTLEDVSSKLPIKPPCRIFFKNELEQPSGSFKLRGMSHLLSKLIDQAKLEGKNDIRVYSSSGGNAGLAAAYGSRFYGLPCTVVLPLTSKQIVIESLKNLGAEVIINGAHWGEADKFLVEEIIGSLDSSIYPIYCHPFDNPLLWDGHSSLIDEIVEENQLSVEDLQKVKGVVCSVGGGGLYNGVVTGLLKNETLSGVPVLAVETKQAPTMHSAIEANKVVSLSGVNTLATSLASPYLAEAALENYRRNTTLTALLDDLDAIKGAIDYYDTFAKLVEPACGATVSVAFDNQHLLKKFGSLSEDDIIIFVVCGGSGTSLETLNDFRKLLN